MATFFDKIFKDLNILGIREIEKIEKELKSGELKGQWDVKQIDEPRVKGYVIQGHFWTELPPAPFDPFGPYDPSKRRPIPKRLFDLPERALGENREPLVDVREEKEAVIIYVETPGEEKKDVQLNATEGKVEIKGKNFYKLIDVPARDLDVENASSKYRNGVLTIRMPRKTASSEKESRKIAIE